MSTRTPPPTSDLPAFLVPRTGMPTIVQSRSREVIYDVLDQNVRFQRNPFGPRRLKFSRPEHHW